MRIIRWQYQQHALPLHKTVREATVNMLANADFYGRRGVVVQKNAYDGGVWRAGRKRSSRNLQHLAELYITAHQNWK